MDLDLILPLLNDPAKWKVGVALLLGAIVLKVFQMWKSRKVAPVDDEIKEFINLVRVHVKAETDASKAAALDEKSKRAAEFAKALLAGK